MNYDKTIRWLLLGVVFLVPLFIWRGIYDVFSFDKMTLLRLLTLAILTCLAFKICYPPLRYGQHSQTTNNKFQNNHQSSFLLRVTYYVLHVFKTNPLLFPILLYFLISLLATIFSVAPWISLLGFYKRYEGLTTLFIYVVLFFTIVFYAREKKFQKKLIWTIVWASFIVSLYGLMQYFKIDPFKWEAQFELTKIFSTFGNPNFFGAYLAMTFPLALYLFLNTKTKEKKTFSNLSRKERRAFEREIEKKRKGGEKFKETEGVWKLWFLGLTITIVYTDLLITLNRGGVLALAGGLLIFAIISGWKIFWQNKKRLAPLVLILFLITLWQGPALWQKFKGTIRIINPKISIGLIKETQAQESESQEKKPILGVAGSAEERVWIWKRSFRIIKDHPWLGIGPDAMALVYWPYEKIGEPMTHRSLVDRAHNDFIDQAVTRGILGLLAYLWIIGTVFFIGWKLWRMEARQPALPQQSKGPIALRSSTFASLRQSRSGLQDDKLFLAAVLASIAAFLIQNQFSFGVSGISSLFWIMMGLLVTEYRGTRNMKHETNDRHKPSVACYVLRVMCLLAITFLTFWTIRFFIADIYYKQGQIFQAKKETDRSLEMYKKAALLNPKESFYQEGVSLSTYNKVRDAEPQEKVAWIRKTIEETEKAIALNPANGFFYNTLGVCYSALAKNGIDKEENEAKAIEFYQKAIHLTPKLTESYNNLGLLLMAQGRLDESYDQLMLALEIGAGQYGTDASSYKLGQKLLDQVEIEKAIKLFQEVVKWRSTDTDALRNLAVAYNKAGQNDKAIEIFEKILKIDPENEYAKKALETIQRR